MLRGYYELTKPGIVYGNLLSTLAAFLYASRFSFPPALLVAVLGGLGLVIASACVFNNFFDRDIDRQMARTSGRALARGEIESAAALTYGIILGIAGIAILFVWVNVLSAALALCGFAVYVFVYTFAKRHTHWGTMIGSISGSVPVVVGYSAVRDTLDMQALILFIVLVLWQMPHFYAIALYRLDEYATAKIPVLPIRRGMRATKQRVLAYIVAFTVVSCSLFAIGTEGYVYLTVMIAVGCAWFWRSLQEFSAPDNARAGRSVFLFSLIVLVVFSCVLPLGTVLP